MGGACGTYGKEERGTQKFFVGIIKKRGQLEEVGVYGGIILKRIFKKWEPIGLMWIRISKRFGAFLTR
jgi:hypothetical protein